MLSAISHQPSAYEVKPRARERGGGNGERPRPQDFASDGPVDFSDPLRRARPEDGGADNLRSAHGRAQNRRAEDHACGGGLRGESVDWADAIKLSAERADDAPAPCECPDCNARHRRRDNPRRDRERLSARGGYAEREQADGLLSVVRAPAQRERERRDHLPQPKSIVDARRGPLRQEVEQPRKLVTDEQTDGWRDEQRDEDAEESEQVDCAEARARQPGPHQPARYRM